MRESQTMLLMYKRMVVKTLRAHWNKVIAPKYCSIP